VRAECGRKDPDLSLIDQAGEPPNPAIVIVPQPASGWSLSFARRRLNVVDEAGDGGQLDESVYLL
jgi:hypothetical protein